MNTYTNSKIKRPAVNVLESGAFPTKSKHRIILNDSANRPDPLKYLTRKSIEVGLPSKAATTTLYPPSRPHRKVTAHNFKKQAGPYQHRYEEEEAPRVTSKSPYVRINQSKGERDPRATSLKVETLNNNNRNTVTLNRNTLNRSSQKIKSGQLLKQNSPRYLFYRQPRSSLSQHYDPSIESSLHKRRISVLPDEKVDTLEEAKELYKNNQYAKAADLLTKWIRLHRSSVEGHYLLGMSLINTSDFSLGIDHLNQVLELDPSYKRSLYLVIALAHKRQGHYDQALAIVDKALQLYPDYYDCLVYRGKLQLKKDNFYHALRDFSQAITTNPNKGFAFIGKATCEKELGHLQDALNTLNQAVRTQLNLLAREKRAIVLYQLNRYDQALEDLEYCSQPQHAQSSTVHYFKGLIHYKHNHSVDALLCFQEALKCDNSREHVTASVEMMLRLKVDEKDFYEAYHILTRAGHVETDNEALNQWRMFLEGSLFLMKKKYKEGVTLFEQLLALGTFSLPQSSLKQKSQIERRRFIQPLLHLYKGYGQLCENNPKQAQKEYKLYQKFCNQSGQASDNLSKRYNQLLMQIYSSFPKAHDIIIEAIALIPNKPEPYLYLAFDIVQNQFEKEEDPVRKQDALDQAIQNLSLGITHLPQLSNNHISTFYYHRAVLHLHRNDFNKAVADVDKAIEKSQDNIPKYFYLRGLTFAVFGNFSQAVQDLTVAINLDQKYAKPYLQRAKCLQIEGNSNQAFLDLQRYITLAPEDTQIHKYAGFLLFQNCAYEDCLAAFSHGSESSEDPDLLLTKAKCHFLLGQEQLAIDLFRNHAQMTYSTGYLTDITMMEISRAIRPNTKSEKYQPHLQQLDSLIAQRDEEDCKIFKPRDMHQLKASIFLLLGEYSLAIDSFNRTLELFNIQKLKEREKHFIEDSDEFEDQWSQVEIKYNLSLCLVCLNRYQQALEMLRQFDSSSQKGKNWHLYTKLLQQLAAGIPPASLTLDVFEQQHRISRLWPRVQLPAKDIHLSMAFSYPFVEPPELLPEFDQDFLNEFVVGKSEQKPQAPWINRAEGGLVFTPNVQVYQNLQLSMTTTRKNEESERNKPVSEMEKSVDMSHSDIQLQTEDLKRKFKLDSMVQMKLKRLMNKQ